MTKRQRTDLGAPSDAKHDELSERRNLEQAMFDCLQAQYKTFYAEVAAQLAEQLRKDPK